MSKFYTERLTELKPLLPRGYSKLITKELVNVDVTKVNKAFAGQIGDEALLHRILLAAQTVADKNTRKKKLAEERNKELLARKAKIA